MARDHEWEAFVDHNENFVDPKMPVRKAEQIHYPGKDNPVVLEVRAGMLERKSKYLKSYTPGWYVCCSSLFARLQIMTGTSYLLHTYTNSSHKITSVPKRQ